jgi:hypothetical protein
MTIPLSTVDIEVINTKKIYFKRFAVGQHKANWSGIDF